MSIILEPAPTTPPPAKMKRRPVAHESVPRSVVTTAIDLDVTDGCNLGCPYCFKNLDKPNSMTLETAKAALEWLLLSSRGAPQIHVNFMGGEPTLRFNLIKEFVAWARPRAKAAGKSVYFSFTSNMTLWTDEIRQWVDENGIGVLMSIDGPPDVQDTSRPGKGGKKYGDTVMQWARSMLRTRPRSDARMTTSPAHVARLYESCHYLWEEIGFQNIALGDADYEAWTEADFGTYEGQMRKICDYLHEDFLRDGSKSLKILSYFIKLLIHPRATNGAIQRRTFPCGAGYNYSMIDHEGSIWPCHRFDGAADDSGTGESVRLGNIFGGAYNEKLANVFQHFDHSRVHKPECPQCPVDPICGGFCPAANLSSTGDLYTPHDSYCRLKNIAYSEAQTLYNRIAEARPEAVEAYIGRIADGREA